MPAGVSLRRTAVFLDGRHLSRTLRCRRRTAAATPRTSRCGRPVDRARPRCGRACCLEQFCGGGTNWTRTVFDVHADAVLFPYPRDAVLTCCRRMRSALARRRFSTTHHHTPYRHFWDFRLPRHFTHYLSTTQPFPTPTTSTSTHARTLPRPVARIALPPLSCSTSGHKPGALDRARWTLRRTWTPWCTAGWDHLLLGAGVMPRVFVPAWRTPRAALFCGMARTRLHWLRTAHFHRRPTPRTPRAARVRFSSFSQQAFERTNGLRTYTTTPPLPHF